MGIQEPAMIPPPPDLCQYPCSLPPLLLPPVPVLQHLHHQLASLQHTELIDTLQHAADTGGRCWLLTSA